MKEFMRRNYENVNDFDELPFVKSCREGYVKMKYTNEFREGIVKNMLLAIKEDVNRPGLKDTPVRVVRMWDEIFRAYKQPPPDVTTFDNGYDGVVYNEKITDEGDFYSHCEHHVVPFFGKYYFGYIPDPAGKILGLSKVARVVDYFSARLQVQERLTEQIVNYLMKCLHIEDKNLDPIAIGLVMEGEHLCKTMRGAKKRGKMTTTVLKGKFKIDPMVRNEFLQWVNKHAN